MSQHRCGKCCLPRSRRDSTLAHSRVHVCMLHRASPENTNVYIGNIPPEWEEEDIKQLFLSFGPVVEVGDACQQCTPAVLRGLTAAAKRCRGHPVRH